MGFPRGSVRQAVALDGDSWAFRADRRVPCQPVADEIRDGWAIRECALAISIDGRAATMDERANKGAA